MIKTETSNPKKYNITKKCLKTNTKPNFWVQTKTSFNLNRPNYFLLFFQGSQPIRTRPKIPSVAGGLHAFTVLIVCLLHSTVQFKSSVNSWTLSGHHTPPAATLCRSVRALPVVSSRIPNPVGGCTWRWSSTAVEHPGVFTYSAWMDLCGGVDKLQLTAQGLGVDYVEQIKPAALSPPTAVSR